VEGVDDGAVRGEIDLEGVEETQFFSLPEVAYFVLRFVDVAVFGEGLVDVHWVVADVEDSEIVLVSADGVRGPGDQWPVLGVHLACGGVAVHIDDRLICKKRQ